MYVSHEQYDQFWGTQFLILVLISFRLDYSGKIIHNLGSKTGKVSVS